MSQQPGRMTWSVTLSTLVWGSHKLQLDASCRKGGRCSGRCSHGHERSRGSERVAPAAQISSTSAHDQVIATVHAGVCAFLRTLPTQRTLINALDPNFSNSCVCMRPCLVFPQRSSATARDQCRSRVRSCKARYRLFYELLVSVSRLPLRVRCLSYQLTGRCVNIDMFCVARAAHSSLSVSMRSQEQRVASSPSRV